MSQRFQYHAFATGFAGRITHPFNHTIEALAPSALSPSGGYSSNRVERFRFKEIVSFRAAYTQVAGSFVEHEGRASWDTVVTSTVEGLEIMGVVKADRIVARLASSHPVKGIQPSIVPLGSTIEGLTIAGHHVDFDWNADLYSHRDTYSKVVDAYHNNQEGFQQRFDEANCVGKHEEIPEQHRWFFPWARHQAGNPIPRGGTIATSLVHKMNVRSDYLKPRGHVIHVPHFGFVVIGQLLIDGNARQLTMLQVEPECAVHMSCTAGSGQTNGQPVPPTPIEE